jgi:ankyrin repeat protein
MLLKAGANVSVQDSYGMTPLHEAAFRGLARMCELLLDHGAAWDSIDSYERTPLHWAAIFGKINAIDVMLNHSAGGGQCDREVGRQGVCEGGWEGFLECLGVWVFGSRLCCAITRYGETASRIGCWAG